MTSRMRGRSIADLINAWYASSDEVWRFGRAILNSGFLQAHNTSLDYDRADALLEYFQAPWHYDTVHAWWVANDWTDNEGEWERGQDEGWAVE